MAARYGADQQLLGIRTQRIALEFDGRRNVDGLLSVQNRDMVARVRLFVEGIGGTLPLNRSVVLGHGNSGKLRSIGYPHLRVQDSSQEMILFSPQA
ncbi:hypothetical protein D9M72_572320 [compost metagenome]